MIYCAYHIISALIAARSCVCVCVLLLLHHARLYAFHFNREGASNNALCSFGVQMRVRADVAFPVHNIHGAETQTRATWSQQQRRQHCDSQITDTRSTISCRCVFLFSVRFVCHAHVTCAYRSVNGRQITRSLRFGCVDKGNQNRTKKYLQKQRCERHRHRR